MGYKIFLSHSSQDKDKVGQLFSHAQKSGIDVYLYEHDCQAGSYLADKIKQSIRASDAVVVLLTHNSQFSPYVQQEIGVAAGSGKLIIPIVQPGIPKECLAMLEGREYIPLDVNHWMEKTMNYLNELKISKETAVLIGIFVAAIACFILFLLITDK